MDILTNRETAAIIWIGLFLIASYFNKQVRTSFINVIKSALKIKLLAYFFLFLGYFSALIYSFYYFKWWDMNNLKDTIIWFTFSGLPIGVFVATNRLESGFWKSLILKNLKLTVFVELIINLFNFSLIIELIIFPAITLTVMLNVFSKHHKDAKDVVKLTNIILIFFGFIVLSYSLYRTITEIYSIENINTIKNILFPVVFSIISIPYMYVFKLIVEYENLFLPLKFGRKRSRELDFWIKMKLIIFCNIQIKKLQKITKMNNYDLMSISSKEEIDDVIRDYKNTLTEGSIKSENEHTRAVQIISVATKRPKLSANTISSEATLRFSDSKKEELVGYVTEHYGAKEVRVVFIPPLNTSSNGLLAVDYYVDTTPTRTSLNDDIANIVIFSESLAEESGISNPNVSVCATTMNGTPLGIGNYYSSTGKAIIDVGDCP